MKDTLVGTKSC